MLNQIIVKGLFGLFNYTISIPPSKPVIILTGPNGYGKTTLLRMLHSISNKNMSFFFSLIFEEIIFQFEGSEHFSIKKKNDDFHCTSEYIPN